MKVSTQMEAMQRQKAIRAMPDPKEIVRASQIERANRSPYKLVGPGTKWEKAPCGAVATVLAGEDLVARVEKLMPGAFMGYGKADADRILVVRSGKVAVRTGKEQVLLQEGQCARFPRGTAHGYGTFGKGEAEVLVVEAAGFGKKWAAEVAPSASTVEAPPVIEPSARRSTEAKSKASDQIAEALRTRGVSARPRIPIVTKSTATSGMNPNSGNVMGKNLPPEIPAPE